MKTNRRLAMPILAAALLAAPASARTFTLGVPADLLTMDPDGANQTFTQVMLGAVYEGLVRLDDAMHVTPALATAWSQPAPDLWRFTLRSGVHFHDGSPLTAADVVYSFQRAGADTSDVKLSVATIRDIREIDPQTVEIATNGPDPILPREIPYVYVMPKAWIVAHDSAAPTGVRDSRISFATLHENGTGPFHLVSRTPDSATILERNADWWDTPRHNLDRVVIRPIGNDGTRVAAMIAGDADMIQGVPLQTIDRLRADTTMTVAQGPDMRTLFLGMDQHSDHLPGAGEATNPLRDHRVRQAIYQAIDIAAVQQRVMRGLSRPTGEMVAPAINGYDAALDVRLPYDPAASRALLAAAGFANGFSITLDCPVGRLVNDEAICQALVPMLARIGIIVDLSARPFPQFSQKVIGRQSSFYLQSWLPPSGDALNTIASVMATPDANQGTFNSGLYSNPALDALIPKIRTETDPARRTALVAAALKIHEDDIGHIPLHQQSVVWAMRHGVHVPIMPDDGVRLAWITLD